MRICKAYRDVRLLLKVKPWVGGARVLATDNDLVDSTAQVRERRIRRAIDVERVVVFAKRRLQVYGAVCPIRPGKQGAWGERYTQAVVMKL